MSLPKRKINKQTGTDSGMRGPHYSIVLAAKDNLNDLVKEILEKNPERINEQDTRTGMTALHWVGANMNYELGEFLFAQKNPPVNPFIQDRSGRYAFDLANEMGNERMIELFLKNIPEDEPDNIVDLSSDSGNPDIGEP